MSFSGEFLLLSLFMCTVQHAQCPLQNWKLFSILFPLCNIVHFYRLLMLELQKGGITLATCCLLTTRLPWRIGDQELPQRPEIDSNPVDFMWWHSRDPQCSDQRHTLHLHHGCKALHVT
ncbi:unnamed protein product, partial [Coregonus sp. 'balchen']